VSAGYARYTTDAHRDLLDAVEHVASKDKAAASRLADRVFSVIEQLAGGDFDGAELRLTTGELVRSWPVPPYRIYYQRESDGILIVRIYHQARRPVAR
jgi:plasmid stabilization system protein ParE